MMASPDLLRAYLSWQSEMGTDEVVLPQPLARKRPSAGPEGAAMVSSSGSSDVRSGGRAEGLPAFPASAAQAVAGSGFPILDSVKPEMPPAGLFQSLSQALEKAVDSRKAEAFPSGPSSRPALRGADPLALPAFSGLPEFFAYLGSHPALLQGEAAQPGTASASPTSPTLPGRFIPGTGPEAAALALVGFEPGEADAAEGKPFQGEPGALLDKMMRAIRMDLRALYLSNLLKARTVDKVWSRRELARIVPLLHIELGLAKAGRVLLLGQECAQAVLKTGKTVEELRQETHRAEGREFFVTYHPLELLRKEELKRKAWEDLQWLQRRMAEAQVAT